MRNRIVRTALAVTLLVIAPLAIPAVATGTPTAGSGCASDLALMDPVTVLDPAGAASVEGLVRLLTGTNRTLFVELARRIEAPCVTIEVVAVKRGSTSARAVAVSESFDTTKRRCVAMPRVTLGRKASVAIIVRDSAGVIVGWARITKGHMHATGIASSEFGGCTIVV